MKRYLALTSSVLTGLLVAGVGALAAPPGVINAYNAICDTGFPVRCIAVDPNGAIAVTGAGSGGTALLKATAVPPTYTEGSLSNPLSSDLKGNLRVLPAAVATASPPAYSEGSPNPVSQDLAGNLRVSGSFASSAKATAADPGYVEGSNNPISQDLSGYQRARIKATVGAYVAGSIASGAVASGAYAAGSISAGALAAGAAIDGWDSTQGAKTDAASTATDATPVSVVSILKEISAKAQAPANLGVTQITSPWVVSGNVGQAGAPWSVSQSGTWTVQQGTPPWAISGAVSQSGLWNVGQTGTWNVGQTGTWTVQQGTPPWSVSQSGAWNVGQLGAPWAVTGSGGAGSPATGVETVQGITGGTPVPETPIPSSAAVAGIAPVVSASLETGHVLKAGAGNLYGIEITTTTVAGYLDVFNSTTVPADGAVSPVAHCYVAGPGTCALQFTPPMAMTVGVSVAFTSASTPFTKTSSATASFSGQVQ